MQAGQSFEGTAELWGAEQAARRLRKTWQERVSLGREGYGSWILGEGAAALAEG